MDEFQNDENVTSCRVSAGRKFVHKKSFVSTRGLPSNYVICKWRNLVSEGYTKLKESMLKGGSYIWF